MSTRVRIRVLAALLPVLCSWLCGCGESGPELGKVTGRITMDGEPMADTYVTFLPMFPGGIELVVKTDADGNYKSPKYTADRDGVLIGKHQVLLSTLDDIKNPNGSNSKIPERFPAIYVNNKSPLYIEVEPGDNDGSFDVSSKPEKAK